MDNTEEQRIISFCTGYGGIEMGLERSGVNVRTVAACEIETYAIANLVDKMEKGSLQPFPIWTDLKTFDGRAFHNKVHGIIGGYPCQPFSQAGKRKGGDDERHLWPYIQQHIDTIRPVWCFFENVAGHLNLGFDEVCKSLWDMGYRVEAGLFTASEVGAPHQRKRLFILAYSSSERLEGALPTVVNSSEGREAKDGSTVKCGQIWPSRPKQDQFGWEYSRTLKPVVGGAVNGTTEGLDANRNRVDRLRLLGNGVVPQTVELAWTTLWKQMTESETNNENIKD